MSIKTKVPAKVAARITAGLRKYQKVLALARDRDINESDTVVIISDFLAEVLGFDKYTEVTTEFSIRGTYCDLAVKVAGTVRYLIEAKAVGITLKELHLRQAIGYASQHGVDWVMLTNGATWEAYKMRFEQPVRAESVFTLDLLDVSPRDREVIERLFLLSREGMAKSVIEDYHQQKDACGPAMIAAVLMGDAVIPVIRRELRRISPGARVEEDEVRAVLKEEVLKRELVEGEEARAALTKARKRSTRSLRRTKEKEALEETAGQEPAPVEAEG